jgi:hypothetical protein
MIDTLTPSETFNPNSQTRKFKNRRPAESLRSPDIEALIPLNSSFAALLLFARKSEDVALE